jgi:hypothetical protein
MRAVRSMLAAIAGALFASTAAYAASAQTKGKDPKSSGEWIADVERPAASKAKNLKAKAGPSPRRLRKSKRERGSRAALPT